MAVRTISTRLAIEGEAEYKASITRINSELKSLQSSLKLTESEFKGQANSIDALKSKGEALNRLHEQQTRKVTELQKALDNARKAIESYSQKKAELTKKIADNEKALEELKKATGDTTEEQAKLTAENAKLNAELVQNDRYLDAAEKGVNGWETQLNNAQVTLNELTAEIKDNDKHLDEASKSADGCATSIDEFGKKTKDAKAGVDALAQALAAAGIAKAAMEIAEALWSCVEASTAFESAMAGVAKTTDMSGEELAAMGESVRELSTRIPLATNELAGIMEVAGQLGVSKNDLLAFTEVMANLGVATNMTAEEAAVMLARFTNVTGMDASFYENLGSVVVALGNNFATTEGEITSMGQRLAASGTLAGLTEPEIMALAAAMSSVGIEAEAGGTAMTQTFNVIETAVANGGADVEQFARIAGMSAQEFSTAWETSPITAIQAFISGLGGLEAQGESAVLVLDDLGLTGVRQGNMLKSLGLASDVLAGSIDMANTAWEENTALVKEAGTRYSTTESKFAMFQNSVENVKAAVGDQLTPALADLADTGTDVMEWAAGFIEENEWLAPVITAVATALGVGAVALAGYTIATKIAIPAITAFNTALAANPFGAIALAVTMAITAIGALIATLPDATSEYDTLTESSKKQYDQLQALNAEYEKACETYGETSQEAAMLAWEVENATAAYEANKQTLEEYIEENQKLNDSIRDTLDTNRENYTEIERGEALSLALVGRLRELASQNDKTVATQEEMKAIIAELNEQLPDLNLNYEDVAAGVGDFGEAIERAIKAQAAQEKHTEAQRGAIDAYKALTTAEAELNDMREEAELLTLAQEEASAAYLEKLDMLTRYDTTGMGALGMLFSEEAAALETADENLENLNAQITVNEQTLATAREEYERFKQELTDYATGMTSAKDETEAANITVGQMNDGIRALAESYQAAYESAKESLDGQFTLWEKVGEITEISLDTMHAGLDSQQEYWESYSTNLDSLLGRGIEGIEEFAQNFTDGSTESAAALATFAAASDEDIIAIMNSMSSVSDLRGEIAAETAGIAVDLEGAFAEMVEAYTTSIQEMTGQAGIPDFTPLIEAVGTAFSDVGAVFEGAGGSITDGLAGSITSGTGTVTAAATAMGQAIEDALRTVLDMHSPSQVTRQIGEDTVSGLVEGLEGSRQELASAVQEMGEELVQISGNSARDQVDRYIEEFSKIRSHTQIEIENLRSIVGSSMSSLPGEMSSIGSQVVNGMINGMNSRSGALYSVVRSIVDSAISAAKSAAATASPSKKTTKIFEDVGEGMVVGLENKRKKVSATAQDVVDDALTLDTNKANDTINRTIQDLASSAVVFDASRIDALIKSINDYAPDLSAPGSVSRDTPAQVIERPVIDGDINVEVTVQGVDEQQAASVGNTIGEEVKRQLRFRGVL